MRTYEQRLDEAREELARASDGETAARLAVRVEILERRVEEGIFGSIFDKLKHPRGRGGMFRATGEH